MSAHRAAARRRPGGLLGLLAAVAAVLSVGGYGTYAAWTDAATATAGSLASGTLDLRVNGAQGNPTAYAWTALTLTDMAPGESKAAVLTVSNAGTTPYALTAALSATGGLVPALTAKVRTGGTASSDATYPRTEDCTGGAQTYSAALTTTATTVVGTGDNVTVAPGATVDLCVVLSLPAATSNAYQGTTAVPTVTLTAAQVMS